MRLFLSRHQNRESACKIQRFMFSHNSVLLKEAVELLDPGPGKVIVDGTVGLGGHSERIAEALGKSGKLIALDRDQKAIDLAVRRLDRFGERVMVIHEDFKNVQTVLDDLGLKGIDGMLLDLGVSSMQLEDAQRGFSFSHDGPLDMRMNRDAAGLTAKEIVNRADREKLEGILWELGQERFSRRIVRAILEERQRRPIETTGQLAEIIKSAVPGYYRNGRIHPGTKTFQALRMTVNGEMESLSAFLGAIHRLGVGGRMVIISFHSLEDGCVKHTFKKFATQGLGRLLTKKPITPDAASIQENPRARSAKMRVFEKGGY